MQLLKIVSRDILTRHFTRFRLVLLFSFTMLFLLQMMIGFQNFEDYLIAFIFVLFLNDLYFKITNQTSSENKDRKRLVMSCVLFLILMLPFIIDSLNVSNAIQLSIYKLGLLLWAQIFLIDSYLHYKQTHSKQWLVFANFAAIIIVLGAFIN